VSSGDTIVLLTDGVYNEIRKSVLVQAHSQFQGILDFTMAVRERLATDGVRDDSSFIAVRI
jgi:serine/threonine protein phosphatase PrpC